MRVGEVYRVKTDCVCCEEKRPNARPKLKGMVVWVHPRGRFAVLQVGGHTECYYPEQLTEHNRVKQ